MVVILIIMQNGLLQTKNAQLDVVIPVFNNATTIIQGVTLLKLFDSKENFVPNHF